MLDNRVKKYQEYRNSLLKEDSEDALNKLILDKQKENTSTLPIDEVISKSEDIDENKQKKYNKAFIILIIVCIVLGVLLIASIISIFAILAFGK